MCSMFSSEPVTRLSTQITRRPLPEQVIAEMGAEEAGAASDYGGGHRADDTYGSTMSGRVLRTPYPRSRDQEAGKSPERGVAVPGHPGQLVPMASLRTLFISLLAALTLAAAPTASAIVDGTDDTDHDYVVFVGQQVQLPNGVWEQDTN